MLTVVSLNAGGLPARRLARLRARAPEICRRLEDCGADVVCLQELWTRRQLNLVAAGLPSLRWVAWRPNVAGQPAGGLATFSRLPLGRVSFTSFAGARASAGSRVFRALKALNSRLQGVLLAELPQRNTLVGNVHLSANRDGDWARANRHHGFQRAQLAALNRAIDGARTPEHDVVILGGDFNLPADGPLPVACGGWHDPFAADGRPTYQPAFLPPGHLPNRIDYLLVRGGTVAEADLLFTEPVAGIGYLSDHVALWARVRR